MMTSKRSHTTIGLIGAVAAIALAHTASPVGAAPGDLLATVTLPGHIGSVGGTTVPGGPSGIVYIVPRGFFDDTWDIYDPPPGLGPQVAALLATKNFVDSVTGNPVTVSCGTWDPTRNVLWVALAGNPGPVHSVDLGDLTTSGNAIATFEFDSFVGGITTCDGIAYDEGRDTLWISPDVNLSVYEYDLGGGFAGFGNQIRAVSPQNAVGQTDGAVSGVTIGSNNTLYIGRNGFQEIRRVDKDTGVFISQFAQTVGRAEDLSCDPITYAPIEAIISKELDVFYEAFEVEEGTCPLPVGVISIMIDIHFPSNPNNLNCKSNGKMPVMIFGMDDFDVTEINVDTLRLDLESNGNGISPVSVGIEDEGSPDEKGVEAEFGTPDGFLDMSVRFDTQEVAELIDCDDLAKGEASETLVLSGELNDGTPFASDPIGDPGIDQVVKR
jgi:hypothetical protein